MDAHGGGQDGVGAFEQRYDARQPARPDDLRTAYERDKGRIIHSSAFRRLQSKTQVLAPHEGGAHRTRLTHSLETAQIGEGIVKMLHRTHGDGRSGYGDLAPWIACEDLIAAACYAHDLGHPPLGHAGERALHAACMKLCDALAGEKDEATDEAEGEARNEAEGEARNEALDYRAQCGFEANAQTLRLLARLMPYSYRVDGGERLEVTSGLNVTRRTLLAVLKYPMRYSDYSDGERRQRPPKCYYDSENKFAHWACEPFCAADRDAFLRQYGDGNERGDGSMYRTFDATIMDYADEIAYSTHDLDDAIARKFVDCNGFRHAVEQACDTAEAGVRQRIMAILEECGSYDALFSPHEAHRKYAIGTLIHSFIMALKVNVRDGFSHPLLRYTLTLPHAEQTLLNTLRTIVVEQVICQRTNQMLQIKGERMIGRLVEVYHTDGNKIIPDFDQRVQQIMDYIPHEPMARVRLIVDHVAAMTDSELLSNYQLLFTAGFGSSREEV